MTEEQKELFKELCPRLVHGVKYMKMSDHNSLIKIEKLYSVSPMGCYGEGDIAPWGFNKVQPILRPLSDLTNPITQDGKTFVPIDVIGKLVNPNAEYVGENKFESGYCWSFHYKDGHPLFHVSKNMWATSNIVVEWLREHHFDIRDFIKKGRAINVNDLKQNCYA